MTHLYILNNKQPMSGSQDSDLIAFYNLGMKYKNSDLFLPSESDSGSITNLRFPLFHGLLSLEKRKDHTPINLKRYSYSK